MTVRDPVLTPVAVGELRPTQITVGMREVQAKRKRWREMGKKGSEFLGKHMMPVILGPKLRHYVVDHGRVVDMIPNADLDANMAKLHDYLGV
jgi:hypothetical protein